MELKPPPQPAGSFRVVLQLNYRAPRLDNILLEALRAQDESLEMKHLSRTKFKKLFDEKKILIKGQPARPSSAVAPGTTWVDVIAE